MPLIIAQRCAACHVLKPRTDFRSVVMGRSFGGHPQRRWATVCRDCEAAGLAKSEVTELEREIDGPPPPPGLTSN